jgi:hypothetical protein
MAGTNASAASTTLENAMVWVEWRRLVDHPRHVRRGGVLGPGSGEVVLRPVVLPALSVGWPPSSGLRSAWRFSGRIGAVVATLSPLLAGLVANTLTGQ